jgi:UDP-2,4-diacetamido-2,4,6-trideoxy-beta-L-altropyranose hydrolase
MEGIQQQRNAVKEKHVMFRPAGINDCARVFLWSNDPDVRHSSFETEPISFETHARWFHTKLRDPDCIFLIILSESGTPVGQIRLQREGGRTAVISISIDRRFRKNGYGTQALRQASERLLQESGINAVVGYVRRENAGSLAMFSKAGFSYTSDVLIGERQKACRMIMVAKK